MNETLVTGGLVFIVAVVLVGPFLFKRVEKQLEAFLFAMGCLAVTISWLWSWHLVKEALVEPIKITLAVLFAGVIFRFIRPKVGAGRIVSRVGSAIRHCSSLSLPGLAYCPASSPQSSPR